jgi:hypothetical protein
MDFPFRFFNHALRFMDAYCHGLTGVQAAWASRRYRGHRKLPDSIMQELDKVGLRADSLETGVNSQ